VPRVAVALTVNGIDHLIDVDSRVTLLDALRDELDLTGTKKGCDQGACGACTVLSDGKRILSCLTLAAQCEGRSITTIEGLSADGALHPMQEAFLRHDAFQCGYCTSGQIMSAVCLLAEGRTGSDADIREFMSGNLCRCGAYPNIVAAIRDVARGGTIDDRAQGGSIHDGARDAAIHDGAIGDGAIRDGVNGDGAQDAGAGGGDA
jgi:xanthine dehydrogenase YagT iron-sulfur-binding subunit